MKGRSFLCIIYKAEYLWMDFLVCCAFDIEVLLDQEMPGREKVRIQEITQYFHFAVLVLHFPPYRWCNEWISRSVFLLKFNYTSLLYCLTFWDLFRALRPSFVNSLEPNTRKAFLLRRKAKPRLFIQWWMRNIICTAKKFVPSYLPENVNVPFQCEKRAAFQCHLFLITRIVRAGEMISKMLACKQQLSLGTTHAKC